MDTITDKKTIACKLTGPELQNRKQEVLQSLRAALLERHELTDGYKYKFPGSDELLDKLVAFIKSERGCCTFFTFNLHIEDNEMPIWLYITGPDGAKEFILHEMEL
jgi:hypothetical protein